MLAIAVPIMISNVSTPLIGIVNTAIVGRYPNPVYIGAVAVGALIFTFAFWAFGFLRMGTTGLTAQAFGAGDKDELAAGLGRALLIAAAAGAALIVLQWPIREGAFALVGASPEVERLAREYFNVRIWAAPGHACELCAARLVHRPGAHRDRAGSAARPEHHQHGAGCGLCAGFRLGCAGSGVGNRVRRVHGGGGRSR